MLFLRHVGLSHQALSRLDELFLDRTLAAGEIVVESAQYADALYVVVEGTIDVYAAEGDQVASLTAGNLFGEKHLLEPGPSTHTLRATTPSKIRELDGPAYDQFAREYPESAFALQAVLARRVLQELKKAQDNLRLLFETFKAS